MSRRKTIDITPADSWNEFRTVNKNKGWKKRDFRLNWKALNEGRVRRLESDTFYAETWVEFRRLNSGRGWGNPLLSKRFREIKSSNRLDLRVFFNITFPYDDDSDITRRNARNRGDNVINLRNVRFGNNIIQRAERQIDRTITDQINIGDYPDDIITNITNIVVISINDRDITQPILIRMRVSYAKRFSRSVFTDNNNDECVLDYLIYKYGNELRLNREKLIEVMGIDTQNIKDGINTVEIKRFCKYYNINMYALSFDDNIYEKYISENRRRISSLIFYNINNHMYPVESNDDRNEITKRGNNPKKFISKYKNFIGINWDIIELDSTYDFIMREYQKEKNIYIKTDNLMEILYYWIENKSLLLSKDIKVINNNQVIHLRLIDKGKKIYNLYANNNYKLYKQALHNLFPDRVYKNQQEVSIGVSYLNYLSDDNNIRIYSSFNDVVWNIIASDKATKSGFNYYFNSSNDNIEIIGIDINKHYRRSLTSIDYTDPIYKFKGINKSDYMIFSVYDIPEKVDAGNGNTNRYLERNNVLYYINTNNFFPLSGNGLYTRDILLYAFHEGIKFDIEYIIRPSYYISKNFFDTFCYNIISKTPIEISKLIINAIIGVCGMRYIKKNKISFSQSKEDVIRAFSELKTIEYFPGEKTSYYHIKDFQKKKIDMCNIYPVYMQTLDNSKILLHKLYKQISSLPKTKIYGIKTDCFIVEHNKQVRSFVDNNKNIVKLEEKDRLEWKKGLNDFSCVGNNNDYIDIKLDLKDPIINIEDKNKLTAQDIIKSNKSILIEGKAGVGKTYFANQISEELEKQNIKFIRIALTNKAALLLRGKTIHSYLKISKDSYVPSTLKIDEKYIIIDEISMLPSSLYNHFYYIKRDNPDIKFICLGDFRQTKPVEDLILKRSRDYENSYILKYITDNNKYIMNINKRNTVNGNKMWNLITDLFNNIKIKHRLNLCGKTKANNFIINICRNNRTRNIINRVWMLKESRNKENKLIIKKDNPDIILYKDLPLMAIKNMHDNNIFNNEIFKLQDFNDDTYTVVSSQGTQNTFKLNTLHNYFTPAYCITVFKSQGETIDKPYIIHDWNRMSLEEKYTAITRCNDINNVHIKI